MRAHEGGLQAAGPAVRRRSGQLCRHRLHGERDGTAPTSDRARPIAAQLRLCCRNEAAGPIAAPKSRHGSREKQRARAVRGLPAGGRRSGHSRAPAAAAPGHSAGRARRQAGAAQSHAEPPARGAGRRRHGAAAALRAPPRSTSAGHRAAPRPAAAGPRRSPRPCSPRAPLLTPGSPRRRPSKPSAAARPAALTVCECRLWLASICAVSGTVSSSSTLPAGGFSMKAIPRRGDGSPAPPTRSSPASSRRDRRCQRQRRAAPRRPAGP